MRRTVFLILIVSLLLTPVTAFSGISSARSETSVLSDGSCSVTLQLQLTLDSISPGLVYPLPEKATHITVNGVPYSASHSGSVRNVDLSGILTAPGSYSLTIRYHIRDIIRTDEKGGLQLTLQLLSGFSYPVDSLEFTVTLPGAAEESPTFTSTYYQETVQTLMTVTRRDNTIHGTVNQRLQDHETLTMILPVTNEMFPQPIAKQWSMDTVDLVMLGIGAAAVLYWLAFLRCMPLRRLRRTTAPDGITAGQVCCRLTGQGADLTLTVLSWAQMGYILIQPDDNGRVLLHKRMDMGNERDDFEQKCFRKLFGKRAVVDGTGYFYAKLCRQMRRFRPGLQSQFLSHSGNPYLFRILCACVGGVSGVSLAAAYATQIGWQIVLSILLGTICFAAAWMIQDTGKAIHSHRKFSMLSGLAAAAVWLLLSRGAGEWNIALIQIPLQFLAGLAALYGGRRNQMGKMNAGELLGLRHYLKTMESEEMKRNLRINPQYFYDLAPYALALGVDRAFARRLKNVRLPECPYLNSGMDGHLTAPEWDQLLRDTVAALDATQKRLPFDRLWGR